LTLNKKRFIKINPTLINLGIENNLLLSIWLVKYL